MSSQQPATEALDVSIEHLREKDLPEADRIFNTARMEAYEQMLAMGFRTDFQGVEMHRPNEPGYSRPGAFVIDDWR